MNFNATKVVEVYADIVSMIGDFRVYADGTVMRYSSFSDNWDHYHRFEDHYDDILKIGLDTIAKD